MLSVQSPEHHRETTLPGNTAFLLAVQFWKEELEKLLSPQHTPAAVPPEVGLGTKNVLVPFGSARSPSSVNIEDLLTLHTRSDLFSNPYCSSH